LLCSSCFQCRQHLLLVTLQQHTDSCSDLHLLSPDAVGLQPFGKVGYATHLPSARTQLVNTKPGGLKGTTPAIYDFEFLPFPTCVQPFEQCCKAFTSKGIN
jgi:hypothetical protein